MHDVYNSFFQQSFDHVDNLKAFEICVSNRRYRVYRVKFPSLLITI